MNLSFWEQDTYFSKIDVVIIGSGIVGLNTALSLKKKNKLLKIIVLERGMLPMGASSKNAGFACFGSVSELMADLISHSEEDVFSLVERRWNGLQRLRKNLGDAAIDFKSWGGFEVFDSKREFEKCNRQIDYLNKNIGTLVKSNLVFKVADEKIKAFGFRKVKHLIENKCEGQIDTGKMISALIDKVRKEGVEVINGFNVSDVDDDGKNVIITSNEGIRVKCKRAVIATNGFAKQFLPAADIIPARAQVLITEPVKGLKLKGTFHYDSGYYYFRNIGNRVLLGGGRNLDFITEETTEFGLTQLVQNKLEEMLKTMILPNVTYKTDMRWSGIMGVGKQKKTIIKQVSTNVFCGVRLGGMGIAIGSLVGEDAATLVNESL